MSNVKYYIFNPSYRKKTESVDVFKYYHFHQKLFFVTCPMSHVTCHMTPETCHLLSSVTGHNRQQPQQRTLPLLLVGEINSLTMQSMLVCNPKKNSKRKKISKRSLQKFVNVSQYKQYLIVQFSIALLDGVGMLVSSPDSCPGLSHIIKVS